MLGLLFVILAVGQPEPVPAPVECPTEAQYREPDSAEARLAYRISHSLEYSIKRTLADKLISAKQEPDLSLALYEYLREELREAAVAAEVIDPKEAKYMFVYNYHRETDLKCVWTRYWELANAPLIGDAERLPDCELSVAHKVVAGEYKRLLERRLLSEEYRAEAMRIAMQQTTYLYECWTVINDANCEYYYINVRRAAMKKLRDELLGPKDYYSGNWPPAIPPQWLDWK